MKKDINQRYSSTSSFLRSLQSESLLKKERRTTILKLQVGEETLTEIDLSCADFIECLVYDTTFYNCDLRGASFLESRLERVKFVDCLIWDIELPNDFSSVAFHNCSSLPSGLPDQPIAQIQHPTTIIEKISSLIETAAKAGEKLPTEKLLSLAIVLAFVAIIAVAYFTRK